MFFSVNKRPFYAASSALVWTLLKAFFVWNGTDTYMLPIGILGFVVCYMHLVLIKKNRLERFLYNCSKNITVLAFPLFSFNDCERWNLEKLNFSSLSNYSFTPWLSKHGSSFILCSRKLNFHFGNLYILTAMLVLMAPKIIRKIIQKEPTFWLHEEAITKWRIHFLFHENKNNKNSL